MKTDKRTNNNLQNTTQKTKFWYSDIVVPFTTNIFCFFFVDVKSKSHTLCPGVVVEIFKYTSISKKKHMLLNYLIVLIK